MPHDSKHRGAAPGDGDLFGAGSVPLLREAAADLSWLLSRGYAHASALELVGNRFSLRDRQRLAVGRCACADQALKRRLAHQVSPGSMKGRALWLDGYNSLMALEAALGGGVVLLGRDGCCRDIMGIHGSYHRVKETETALELIGTLTTELQIPCCHWWLDKPVSNSGRLKTLMLEIAGRSEWNWRIDLVMNPDRVLMEAEEVIATADSAILDQCDRWFNLTRLVMKRHVRRVNLVDLSLMASDP